MVGKRGEEGTWGHQTALLGGLHFSALHWGLVSQNTTKSPCIPLFCWCSLGPAHFQAGKFQILIT